MKELVKTSRVAGQLEKLFRMLNDDWFSGELETPVITIQSTPRVFGHYTLYDAWSVKGDGRKEINIGAGTLDRPIEEVIATLLHEMCHMYNDTVLHVQDCSGSSRMYHNKCFRDTCLAHGLLCERSDKYGWSYTEPSDALIDWILEHDVQEIRLNRNEPHGVRISGGTSAANGGTDNSGTAKPTAAARKNHSRKWVCPTCGMIARTTKQAFLVCGECLQIMEER